MGSLAQSSNLQNCIKRTNKIPEYARDFEKEWLTIRGLNKECGNFIKSLDFGGDLFNSSRAKGIKYCIRVILKAEELGKIKEISSLIFKECDVNRIYILKDVLDCYLELYRDIDSFEFDYKKYDLNIDKDYPGFREFYQMVSLIKYKIEIEELTLSEFMRITDTLSFDSDSDSDSDSD